MQIEDWISDLREFSPPIVARACDEWRQTHTRRPVPADIRGICIALQIAAREAAEPKRIAAPIANRRPPPHVVRPDFVDREKYSAGELSDAEIRLVWKERAREAVEAGYPPGDAGVMAYMKARLRTRLTITQAFFVGGDPAPEMGGPQSDRGPL